MNRTCQKKEAELLLRFCEAKGFSCLLAVAQQSFVRSKLPDFSIVRLQKANVETLAEPEDTENNGIILKGMQD